MTRGIKAIVCRRFGDAGFVLRGQNGHFVELRGAAADGIRTVSHRGARPGHEFQLSGRHARAYHNPTRQSPG